MKQFILKPRIYFNRGSMELLSTFANQRALIVSDATMNELGYVEKAAAILRKSGCSVHVYADAKPDPSVALVAECLAALQESRAEVVVAVGGGSVIDTAKAAIFMLRELCRKNGLAFERPLFVAIPSTSGTGSEVTSFSVVTDGDGQKTTLIDPDMTPDVAILDPTCTNAIPHKVTMDTGMDVLVHALEAYVSVNASDFTDAMAEKAIKVVFENLPILNQDLNDDTARERMHNASCLAGAAFENAGLGINHSIAHILGGTYHIAHGRANALLIEPVISFNAELSGKADSTAAKKYAYLATILGLQSRTPREGTVNLMEAIRTLKREVGIESCLHDLGIEWKDFESNFELIAEQTLADRCTDSTPKKPNTQDVLNILIRAY